MKKLILALTALAILTTACTASTGGTPIPQSGKVTDTTAATSGKVAAKASTCDDAREALLTGSAAQIQAALAALKADTTADGTAREYADYYLNRDRADASMRSMDVGLIRMACSI